MQRIGKLDRLAYRLLGLARMLMSLCCASCYSSHRYQGVVVKAPTAAHSFGTSRNPRGLEPIKHVAVAVFSGEDIACPSSTVAWGVPTDSQGRFSQVTYGPGLFEEDITTWCFYAAGYYVYGFRQKGHASCEHGTTDPCYLNVELRPLPRSDCSSR